MALAHVDNRCMAAPGTTGRQCPSLRPHPHACQFVSRAFDRARPVRSSRRFAEDPAKHDKVGGPEIGPTALTWTEAVSVLRQRRESDVREPEASVASPRLGQVFLVGTGPGDPSLLTLRALQLMQTADVVLYDRLVSDEILALIHPGARMLFVGKGKGFHSSKQEDIHELLLQFAEEGATVVRLKGGDPYVFGRGGEELEYLEQKGVRVWCVPGITAASGICAELGIPMTHRGIATSVRFLTGHVRDAREAWDQLDECVRVSADPHTTLVVYMGLSTLPQLVATLVGAGLDPQTPAVAVERGTTVSQRAVGAPVAALHDKVTAAGLKSPTLIVMGGVCALSPHYPRLVGEAVVEGRMVPRDLQQWDVQDYMRLISLGATAPGQAGATGPSP